MSKTLINQYYNNLDRAVQFGKSRNETSVRNHFWNLLNDYARGQNYELVTEVACLGTKGKKVYPDGIVKNLFGLDIGLWESKDEKDTIDDEINTKQRKGYPFTNILFEDTNTAVLIQRGQEVMRVSVRDADKLHKIITEFIGFKSEVVEKFEIALEKFKEDIPTILSTLRKKINDAGEKNKAFIAANDAFLELCKVEINPDITAADIREMVIQHILTSDLFNKIFDDPEFHTHNTIAKELEKLISILFPYSERKNLLASIEHYYDAIRVAAAGITDHHEKQKFLKVLYENFYKVYNPKAADRLGVVYTPNELVAFMVDGTNYLLEKHFNKTLADKNVDILDPATGTGTFVCDIVDKIPKPQLQYKYKNEIHANEVAILPYYVANLNIEFTFKQRMGYYEEYPNICFVDTLDNTSAMSGYGKQAGMFGLTSENTERIKRQNSKKISVIIGNPPYNANQQNENENNKNREYREIDKRIKNTFIEYSTAQKTKVYDMYARFYRWAMDRLSENGIIAFVTNRSFIDSRTFDGFRQCIQEDFTNCYIIDTKSDVRVNPKIAGTTHNVFGIQTGVAVMFLVKKGMNELVKGRKENTCKIEYATMEDHWRKEEKLQWLKEHPIDKIDFTRITPDKNNNWINIANTDFDSLIPLANKETKLNRSSNALFKLNTLGVVTARDEYVLDFNRENLINKVKYLINKYNSDLSLVKSNNREKVKSLIGTKIKWSRAVINDLMKGIGYEFSQEDVRLEFSRPYVKKYIYFNQKLNEMQYQLRQVFTLNDDNLSIIFSAPNSNVFSVITTDRVFEYKSVGTSTGGTESVSLYRYNEKGERIDNITDWGFEQFVTYYKDKKIKKEDIFNYTYAVLHNPAYRKKYELNLKREFPRLPFYKDFWQWAKWGKELMGLHINYEQAKPYELKEHTIKAETKGNNEIFRVQEPEAMYAIKEKVKVKLKADKETGTIEIDEITFLTGVPKEAWEYKLGNRSALEWVLDQYKEKKPSDPTIAEKFNTYRFADYKEKVIDLLKRVCTVSIETMEIIREMEKEQ